MGDWSLMEGQLVDTVGEEVGGSRGTLVTSGAANTKGNWYQLVASSAYNTDGLLVFIAKMNASDFLVDIGIGAAGSENVVVPNLVAGNNLANNVTQYLIPISIPAGTRIAACCQAVAAAVGMLISISLLTQGFMPSASLGRVTAYGANTADSGGTSVDPGAVLNTKNAYSQINGVTANPIRALLIGIGGQANSVRTICYWLVDVAVGAAGSERIILPDLQLGCNATGDDVVPTSIGPFFIDIPAGTRLAARAQCDIVDAADRLFDIVLYGID